MTLELPSSSPITSTGILPIGTSYADSNLLWIFSTPPAGQRVTVEKSVSPRLTDCCASPARNTRSIPSNDGMSAA